MGNVHPLHAGSLLRKVPSNHHVEIVGSQPHQACEHGEVHRNPRGSPETHLYRLPLAPANGPSWLILSWLI